MTYTCTIYYLHDSFVNLALNRFGKEIGKNLDMPLSATIDNATFALDDNKRIVVQTIKGLSRGSIARCRSTYAIVEGALITPETVDIYNQLVQTTGEIFLWEERELQE